jgi:cytochrome c-type biogenesis protein CcmH/NrfF
MALTLLTMRLADLAGDPYTECVTERLGEQVCHEARFTNSTVLLAGLGLILVTAVCYRLWVERRYGNSTDDG